MKEVLIRTCPKCKVPKALTEFYNRRGDKSGPYCKTCSRVYQKSWNDRHLTTERQRGYRLRYLYGLSHEDQSRLPDSCEICGSNEALHIDHDHDKNEYRGMLCRNHNIGLGYFNDDPELLIRAAEYILAHEQTS